MAVSVHLVALSVHLVDGRLTLLVAGAAANEKKIWRFHFLLYLCREIIKAKTKPKYHAMKTTPSTFTVDSDPHDRLLYRMCHFIQAASPPDTGAGSISRSIAITLPAAMLRPLPQASVGGKKHASLDPPPKRGRKKRKGGGTGLDTLCYHLSQGHGLSGRARSLCSPLSQGEFRVGYFYKIYVRKNK